MTNHQHENLKSAIDSLQLQEKVLLSQIAEIQTELDVVREALTPLRKLVAKAKSDAQPELPGFTKSTEPTKRSASGLSVAFDESGSLPDAITQILQIHGGQLGAAEIANHLLEYKYPTTSQTFANVVGTALRRNKDVRFTQDEFGKWSLIAS